VIVGLRPESFEDASLTGDVRDRGVTFTAKVALVEQMGSEQYVYFDTEGGIESRDLQELAEDIGRDDAEPSEQHTVIARVDAGSGIRRGEDAQLWVDASKLHLFDPDSGESLARR
jgi:multiple sugar transport system ATP-binding protein